MTLASSPLGHWYARYRERSALSLDRLVPAPLRDLQPHPVALGLAAILATHGLRKGSLSRSGAAAAFLVGYLTLANPFPGFGVVLIAFYLAGSRATKVKAGVKAKLEREGYEEAGAAVKGTGKGQEEHKSSSGGHRDAWQVLSNGLTGCLGALAFRAMHSGEVPSSHLPGGSHGGFLSALFGISQPAVWDSGHAVCALDSTSADGWTRLTTIFVLGHFTCCMGDVLASELGILASSPPRLVTAPWRSVPPGTNGGISAWGTTASALGGTFIGAILLSCLAYFNQACHPALFSSPSHAAYILALATLGGFAGSMLDSLLGAVGQRTWYNTKSKQVLVGRLPEAVARRGGEEWEVITGWDLLTNGQVNFLSSALTALGLAALDRFLSPDLFAS